MSIAKDFFYAPFQYKDLLFLQLSRQLKKKTHGRVLSYFWLMLEPLAVVSMMSLVFPLIFTFRTHEYAIYLLSGLLAWNFISASLQRGCQSIKSKVNLMSKVGVPVFVFNAATVLELACYMGLTTMVLLLVSWWGGFLGSFNPLIFIYTLLVTLISSYSVMYILGILVIYVQDIQNVVSLLVRGLFFLTPIIYPADRIPEQYQLYMEFNPVHQYIRLFRYSIYYEDSPQLYETVVPLLITLSLVVLAVMFTKVFKNKYMLKGLA